VQESKYPQIGISTSELFFESTLFSMFSPFDSERLMTAYKIRPTSPVEAFGQLMAVVIAIAAAGRAV
jgi:hypothetical protein